MLRPLFAALLLSGLPLAPAAAEEKAEAATETSPLDHAKWLAGRWVGTGMGGEVEEIWSPVSGGQMVGHFRYSREGKVVFYEILLIDMVDAGMRMRVKHFNADFTAWEDKAEWVEFEPISASSEQLKFNGLVLDYDGETMIATLRMRQKDGEVKQVPFTFTRAD